MGFPKDDDSESEDDPRSAPPGKILPFAPRPRPDWLTGPDENALGAADPAEGADRGSGLGARSEPVLTRPGSAGAKSAAAADTESSGPLAAAAEPERRPAGPGDGAAPSPAPWAPAASSVPVLRAPLPAEPVSAEGEDKEPHAPPVRSRGLPGGAEDRRVAAAIPAAAPLQEPWWLVALDALRSDWRAQAGVGGAVLGLTLVAYLLWPHGMDSTLLSSVRRHPGRYDGRTVRVRGRVGDDVFSVGSGWAFYLTQDRDTIVAFTRARPPQPREVVSVQGQVSTGFLDGQPRQALFEEPQSAK